jgi:hypothetical protein
MFWKGVSRLRIVGTIAPRCSKLTTKLTHHEENEEARHSPKWLPGFQLPLLGSNQDSPDPESGVLPVTPRGTKIRQTGLAPAPFAGTHVK